ncbi:MAG TPA: branched-chain amino acid ABC transporter permease [Bacillota bacterium]|nr:branched-chain amino acid ABC transporter permease [Bacillota bacterium]
MFSLPVILQFLFSGITQGSVYALIGLGFMVIYNSSEIINFAQGEFVMLGGMLAVTFHTAGLPLPLAILLSVLAVTFFGVAFQHLAVRPLQKATTFSVIIMTIGASIFIRGLALLIWGTDTYSLPFFITGDPIIIGGAAIIPHYLLVFGASIVLMLILNLFFKKTLVGQAMRASAVNRQGASLCGIKPEWMVKISFGLSAGLAAISGIIIAPTNLTGWDVGIKLGLKGFVVAIIGGLNSFVGTICGGFLLGIIEALGAGFISSQYKDAITFGLLIIILFLRPNGIFGRKAD